MFIGCECVLEAAGPDAGGLGDWVDADPCVDEACACIVGQGDLLGRGLIGGPLVIGAGQESELDEDLETVADADHGHSPLDGSAEGRVEALPGFHGEDAARGDVIAVAETAGEPDEIKLVELCGVFDKLVEVNQLYLGTGHGKGAGELLLAVGTGGSDHDRFWHG